MNGSRAFLVCAVAASTFVASPARAQGAGLFQEDESRRPERGVFASGSSGAEQLLAVSGTAGAGYDSNVRLNAQEAGLGGVPGGGDGSPYSLFSGGINYSVNKPKFGFATMGFASNHSYMTTPRSSISEYNGGVGVSFAPSSRTRVSANQSVTYQPFSLYSLFPQPDPQPLGEPPSSPDLDYYVTSRGYLSYYTSAAFSHELSKRATLTGEYSRDASDVPAGYGKFVSQTGKFRFTRRFRQGLALRLGYGYTSATYANLEGRQGYHYLDTGVDYSHTISFSRRTTLSFATGASAITRRDDTDFNILGNADLRHEIGRSWDFTVGYRRDVQFVEVYGGPLEYQSLNAQLSGLITRRVSFHAGVGATGGTYTGVGADVSENEFGNIYASTGIGTALNRYLSLNVNYSYYWYELGQVLIVPGGVDIQKGRHTLLASINAWKPLFERGRRSDAPR